MKNNIDTAILIVNGGQEPQHGHWISLCIGKILQHTKLGSYQLYIWNNNVDDKFIPDFLKFIPNCTLFQKKETEKFSHFHIGPLQKLYEKARNDGFKYIVTLDSDAHPIKSGWLEALLTAIDAGNVLAGVWRDELQKAIPPYIHPSCLCTSVDYIETHQLRFDYIAPNTSNEIHDSLSVFTENAISKGLSIYPLKRSNIQNIHRLISGIYGDYIYHHGAGSRKNISFWDEKDKTQTQRKKNDQLVKLAANQLFNNYSSYIDWLGGTSNAEIESCFDYTSENKYSIELT